MKDLKVDPLDQVLCRNIISGLFGLLVGLYSQQPFTIKKDMRCILFGRSITGVSGNTAMTFGIALVPLVYQQTIVATAPFWASIFAFCLIGETIGCFSKVAMLISFAGVILIACSDIILDEEVSEE